MKKTVKEEGTGIFSRAVRGVKDFFYGISVKLHRPEKRKKQNLTAVARNEELFFWGLGIIPLVMFAFNMIFINLNSILLAFQQYDTEGIIHFAGFDNFVTVFNDYFHSMSMQRALGNSLKVYGITLLVTTFLPVLFYYYLYKKALGTEMFKVFLMLPSIISGIATVLVFKALTDLVLPDVLKKNFGIDIGVGLLSESETKFGTIMFYSLFMTFGGGMLTNLGAMNSVDKSVVEAGTIDGVGFLGEFWHIVLPKSYTVIFVGFMVGFVSIFTNDFGLYAFYGFNADSSVATLGYTYTVAVKRAQEAGNFTVYTYWAAWGLIASAVAVPLSFLARHLIYKYGPSED